LADKQLTAASLSATHEFFSKCEIMCGIVLLFDNQLSAAAMRTEMRDQERGAV
jgi:hypothetical protein